MAIKGILSGRSASYQLAALLSLILIGAIAASLVGMGIFYAIYGLSADITENANMLRLLQFLSSIGTFLFPAIGLAWLCSYNFKDYLSIGPIPDARVLILTFIGMFLLAPAINLTELLNQQLQLPAFMESMENWMRTQEEAAEKITAFLLSDTDIVSVLYNLLVIAIAAAVTEEFIFRGALQRIIERWTGNHHIVIWTVAFIFSAFHLQFYGLIPRMLLGAYFGYLLYWSKNIWIPVFAHFCNNAIAVVVMSTTNLKDNEYLTGDISESEILPYSLFAIATTILFFWIVKIMRKIIETEKTSIE